MLGNFPQKPSVECYLGLRVTDCSMQLLLIARMSRQVRVRVFIYYCQNYNDHRLDGLKHRKLILSQFWSQNPKSRCQQVNTPSRGSRRDPTLFLFQLPVIVNVPQLLDTSFQSFASVSHCLLSSVGQVPLSLLPIWMHVMAFLDPHR